MHTYINTSVKYTVTGLYLLVMSDMVNFTKVTFLNWWTSLWLSGSAQM